MRTYLLIILCTILSACSGGSSPQNSSASGTSTTQTTSSSSTPPRSSASSSTQTISIQWEIPTNREDGSPLLLSEIDRYEIYYFRESLSSGGSMIAIDNPSTTSTAVTLSTGRYYFSISSVDINGIYSDLSTYLTVTIP